jgi:hypothetical protein
MSSYGMPPFVQSQQTNANPGTLLRAARSKFRRNALYQGKNRFILVEDRAF